NSNSSPSSSWSRPVNTVSRCPLKTTLPISSGATVHSLTYIPTPCFNVSSSVPQYVVNCLSSFGILRVATSSPTLCLLSSSLIIFSFSSLVFSSSFSSCSLLSLFSSVASSSCGVSDCSFSEDSFSEMLSSEASYSETDCVD